MKKCCIVLIIVLLITAAGCREFSNPVDPYLDLTAFFPLEGSGENKISYFGGATVQSAAFVNGHFDDAESAVELNGIDSYIDCGGFGTLEAGQSMTVSLWFKFPSAPTDNVYLIGKCTDDSSEPGGWYLLCAPGMMDFTVDMDGSYRSHLVVRKSPVTYYDNKWHYLVLTGNATDSRTEISMYVDNVKVGTQSTSSKPEVKGSKLIVGAKTSDSGYAKCNVDNIRVYAKVLSSIGMYKDYLEKKDGTTGFDSGTLVKAVSSGSYHSLFLKNNGEVWSCGGNTNGQLGHGNTTNLTAPAKISALSNIVAVEAGSEYSLALTSGGAVYAWGKNTSANLLGLGTSSVREVVPVQIPGLSSIKQISAGYNGNLALDEDGNVWKWGDSLGNTPQKIAGITGNAVSIAAGYEHFLILKSDKTVVSFGGNAQGQLGNYGQAANASGLYNVYDLTDVAAISAGGYYSLALKSDGTVYGWGINNYGQTGHGSSSTYPIQVKSGDYGYEKLSDITAISAGHSTASAVAKDGQVYTWGYDVNGALGTSTSGSKNYAVKTDMTSCKSLGDLSGASGSSRFAVDSSGSVYGWGRNSNYQLGLGTNSSPMTYEELPLF